MYFVGLLLPISYGVKHIWALPGPFVEPVYLLVTLLWLSRRRQARFSRTECAIVVAFVVATAFALRHPDLPADRWTDAVAHTLRLGAFVAMMAVVRAASAQEVVQLARGFIFALVATLALSTIVALIGLGLIPNLLGVDTQYVDFDSRFRIHLDGGGGIPRLFGLFHEPAPYGALGVGAIVFFRAARASMPPAVARAGAMAGWATVIVTFSDQALLAAAILAFVRPGVRSAGARRKPGGRLLPWALGLVAFMYLVDRIALKGSEFSSMLAANAELWGSSGGERMMNALLAIAVWLSDPITHVVGVGPSLFGLFASQWFPVLDSRHQVQFFPADILVSLGLLGFGAFLAFGWTLARSAAKTGMRHCVLALGLAILFQSDFKIAAIAVAIGIIGNPHVRSAWLRRVPHHSGIVRHRPS
jgi:hypothetical protein